MALTDHIDIPIDISKKTTAVIFFVIETSKNMAGSRIIAVNNNMKKALAAIDDISGNCDTELKTAVLTFSSGSNWITTDGPVTANNLEWKDQEASGSADFGSACKSLHEKLAKNKLMENLNGSWRPIIILLVNGNPTDDYKSPLAELKQLQWFKKSYKLACAIGDNANTNVLVEFTGTPNAVIKFDNSGERHIDVFTLDIAESIKSLCRDIYVIDDWSPSQLAEQMKNYGVDIEFNPFL